MKFYSGNSCLVLQRAMPFGSNGKTITQYCIANGTHAGRWTRFFGPHCLADSRDCKSILEAQAELHGLETQKVNVTISLEGD